MIVYAVVDDSLSPDFPLGVELEVFVDGDRVRGDHDALSPTVPLGDALEVFIRREDAERFIEEVRRDAPEIAATLRFEESEFEVGGRGRPEHGSALVPNLDTPFGVGEAFPALRGNAARGKGAGTCGD